MINLTKEQRMILVAAQFTVALFENNKLTLGLEQENITVLDVLNESLREAEEQENYEFCQIVKQVIDIIK
jgi:hypothetical protein